MIEQVHTAMISVLQTGIPGIRDVRTYGSTQSLKVPACVVHLESIEPAPEPDDGSGRMPLSCRWEIFAVLASNTPNVELKVREMAAVVAQFLQGQRFSVGSPMQFVLAEPDEFGPEFSGGTCWRVEFEQTIYLGESEWTAEGVVPSTVMVGNAPDIGEGNAEKYEEVKP